MVTTQKPRLVIEYCHDEEGTIIEFKQQCIKEKISYTRKLIEMIKSFLLTKNK